jgi:hypothetical protein
VTFVEGHTNVLVKIPIEGSGFLAIGTTFTATLITVNFLGAGNKGHSSSTVTQDYT